MDIVKRYRLYQLLLVLAFFAVIATSVIVSCDESRRYVTTQVVTEVDTLIQDECEKRCNGLVKKIDSLEAVVDSLNKQLDDCDG